MSEDVIKPGDILMTSWGYDMTINDYCKVLENTGKTLKCIMVGIRVDNDNGAGNGHSMPVSEMEIGEPFRIRIRSHNDFISLVGSYPCAKGSTRKGYWYVWDGSPNYYNTRD